MPDTRRMRILLVTRNLPPLIGGMERLNWHMAEELRKVAEVRVVGPQGSAAQAPAGIDVREASLKPLWKFLLAAARISCREARQWRPDIVLAGSGLTAPLAYLAAHTCGARTAVYVHGLDIAVKHPAYRSLWLPAIRRMGCVIANSSATADLCRGVGIDPGRVAIVHPGVELPSGSAGAADSPCAAFLPERDRGAGAGSAYCPDAFRAHHRLGTRSLLLSVGRLSTRKGLREFVSLALPRIVAARPDALLVVIGDAPSLALHAQAQTPSSIQATADAAGVGRNLLFLGTITDYGELGAAYRAADVHVFPVRDIPGDPEGFGMVAVEAAAHGLPTAAFATGGVVDAVAEGQSGRLVVPGDYAAFADAVLQILAGRDALRQPSMAFARRFAWPEFGRRVHAALRGLVGVEARFPETPLPPGEGLG